MMALSEYMAAPTQGAFKLVTTVTLSRTNISFFFRWKEMATEVNNFFEQHYSYFASRVFAKKNPPPKPKPRPDETSDVKKKTGDGGGKDYIGQHKV